MSDQSYPERIFVWRGTPQVGWIDAEGERATYGEAEYIRADCGSFYQEKDIDALMDERDKLRAELDRMQGVLDDVGSGVVSIAEERRRQQIHEGWTHEHDDAHTCGEMARAAACYALVGGSQYMDSWRGAPPNLWPQNWSEKWWKMKDRRSNLVRAGALIAAEIDRLDRVAMRNRQNKEEM